MSLTEFEYVARESITLPEAWFAVPGVLQMALPCPVCCAGAMADIKFRLKDGTLQAVGGEDPVSIGFIVATRTEEGGEIKMEYPLRFAIPRQDEGYNPSSIVLGVPNGVDLPPCGAGKHGQGVSLVGGPADGPDGAGEGA